MATLHYTSGGGIDSDGTYSAGQAGFNLADVQSVNELNALPDGVKGMVWLNQTDGVNSSFTSAVEPFIGNPKLYGFYLADEPDPTGKWGTYATADNLRAESDWIHANVPGAKTFITMMNMGSTAEPDFSNTFNPENSHIDLYGVGPYLVRTGSNSIDFGTIDKQVAAAIDSGIPLDHIVPVYQAFGGGNWTTDTDGKYIVPTAEQEQQMLDHWATVVPNPAFDYAYSWNTQNGDTALSQVSELQKAFLQHNTSDSAAVTGSTTPASAAGTNATADTSQVDALPVTDNSHAVNASSDPTPAQAEQAPATAAPVVTAPQIDTGNQTTPDVTGSDSSGTTGGHSHHGWHSSGSHGHGSLDFSQLLSASGHAGGSTMPAVSTTPLPVVDAASTAATSTHAHQHVDWSSLIDSAQNALQTHDHGHHWHW